MEVDGIFYKELPDREVNRLHRLRDYYPPDLGALISTLDGRVGQMKFNKKISRSKNAQWYKFTEDGGGHYSEFLLELYLAKIRKKTKQFRKDISLLPKCMTTKDGQVLTLDSRLYNALGNVTYYSGNVVFELDNLRFYDQIPVIFEVKAGRHQKPSVCRHTELAVQRLFGGYRQCVFVLVVPSDYSDADDPNSYKVDLENRGGHVIGLPFKMEHLRINHKILSGMILERMHNKGSLASLNVSNQKKRKYFLY